MMVVSKWFWLMEKGHYHQCSENFPYLGEIFKITKKKQKIAVQYEVRFYYISLGFHLITVPITEAIACTAGGSIFVTR